jgi:hypothetical protein
VAVFVIIKLMKESTEDLLKKVTDAKQLVKVGGRYQHYKGGFYRVIDIAIMEEDTEPCVIYEAEYAPGLSFVRPLHVWLENVPTKDGTLKRFKLVEGMA